jgi:hypothetical protein
MRTLRLLPLALGLAFAAPLAAQNDTTRVPQFTGPRVEPIGGLRIGFPQKVSAYLGAVLVERRYEGGYSGWSVTVEPGLGGGLVGVGRTGSGGWAMTARTQVAVLRTWGDPWLVGPDATYVGLDARFSMILVGLALGGYVRIPEEGEDPGALLTASLVIGL